MADRLEMWSPSPYVGPNDIEVSSADFYEERAVDLLNRGYTDKALVAAVLSLAARMEGARG